MDFINSSQKCPKCGQGGFEIKIDYKPPSINLFDEDEKGRYCTECGKSLFIKCTKCNGTGIYRNPFSNRENYCAYCGRAIEYDDTCPDCKGDGEIYDYPHHLYCKPRLF